ncbi:MAG: hypothetical protein RQM95_10140 [Syntrophaceticus schinkii]
MNVAVFRYFAVVTGGMLAGAGGAYLSLAYSPSWVQNMSAGRGWIAVALVIFAMWNPLRALLGAYLFGGIEALGFRLQAVGITVSPFFFADAALSVYHPGAGSGNIREKCGCTCRSWDIL